MVHCVACGEELADRLFQFGDSSAIMCMACHFGEFEGPYADSLYTHEPILDEAGRQIGHRTRLTELGVAFFDGDGQAGDLVALHFYGQPPAEGAGAP